MGPECIVETEGHVLNKNKTTEPTMARWTTSDENIMNARTHASLHMHTHIHTHATTCKQHSTWNGRYLKNDDEGMHR